MAVSTATRNVPLPRAGRRISTEFGVSGFQVAMGVFGGLGALIAARQLQTVERDLYVTEVAVPVLVGGTATIIAASLLPSR